MSLINHQKIRRKSCGLARIKGNVVTDIPYEHGVPAGLVESPSSVICADGHQSLGELGCDQTQSLHGAAKGKCYSLGLVEA